MIQYPIHVLILHMVCLELLCFLGEISSQSNKSHPLANVCGIGSTFSSLKINSVMPVYIHRIFLRTMPSVYGINSFHASSLAISKSQTHLSL